MYLFMKEHKINTVSVSVPYLGTTPGWGIEGLPSDSCWG